MNKSYFPLIICALSFFGFTVLHQSTPYQFPELQAFPEMPINPENEVTNEGVTLGRYLFYDPILSQDSSVSCSSCHQQQYAFSDGPERFSRGIRGDELARNTPPLFNLAWNKALFWDGKANNIEAQVFFPIRDHLEMNLNWDKAVKRLTESDFYPKLFYAAFDDIIIDSVKVAFAIAQFERTLISHNSKLDKALRRTVFLSDDELKGLELMNDQSKGNCLHCHTTDANFVGTTGAFSNNGLDSYKNVADLKDIGRAGITQNSFDVGAFKIPSLRNIALTAPYMHDGRFNTLEEVLNFYTSGVQKNPSIDPKMHFEHANGVSLTDKEQKQMVTFLYALTDSVFITASEFSNPFKH